MYWARGERWGLPLSDELDERNRALLRFGAYRRGDAERYIDSALVNCESAPPTADQLADLADAIDSYTDGVFGVAVALAQASMQRRAGAKEGRRPFSDVRSIQELRNSFAAARERFTLAASRAGSL